VQNSHLRTRGLIGSLNSYAGTWKGQAIWQYLHPMQIVGLYTTAPSADLVIAPTMQAETHEGYKQCMHCALTNVWGKPAWSGDGLPAN
jgi:hypothetical protein